jgi:hypothetical protein
MLGSMRPATRNVSAALCLAFATAVAPPALAQSDTDRATARALGQDGERALAAKEYAKAEDDFRRADSLVHAPTLVLGLARALAGEGKVVEAQEAYNRIVREGVPPGAPSPFARALEAAKKEVQDVEPRIGAVTITVKATAGGDVPNVKVVVDDVAVNAASLGVRRLTDPGAHVVRATADGYLPAELKLTVVAGANVDAPLSLDKDLTAPAPPPQATPLATPVASQPDQAPHTGASPWPWVAFGVGGAGLGVGVVTGVLAIGKHSDLAKSCTAGCGPAQQSELDSYHTMGLLSTIGFIVAGAGAAAGVTLLVVQPKAEGPTASTPAATLVVGPGTIGAVGRF